MEPSGKTGRVGWKGCGLCVPFQSPSGRRSSVVAAPPSQSDHSELSVTVDPKEFGIGCFFSDVPEHRTPGYLERNLVLEELYHKNEPSRST